MVLFPSHDYLIGQNSVEIMSDKVRMGFFLFKF